MKTEHSYQAIVIGASAGGLAAFDELFSELEKPFSIPIIMVQHRSPDDRTRLDEIYSRRFSLSFTEVEDKEKITSSMVYIAPPNYHLLLEEDHTLSLSVEPKVNYSRPSIDVLFETAAFAYRKNLVGIILSGANNDGAAGITVIKQMGGLTLAQDPESAYVSTMPQAAIDTGSVDRVLSLSLIRTTLLEIDHGYVYRYS